MLAAERVPQDLAVWVANTISEPWMIILALNLVMLVVVAFLDLPAAALLLGPLFVTIGQAIGLDPVQPLPEDGGEPPHRALYAALGNDAVHIGRHRKSRDRRGEKSLLPFYLVALGVLMAISFIPALTIY